VILSRKVAIYLTKHLYTRDIHQINEANVVTVSVSK